VSLWIYGYLTLDLTKEACAFARWATSQSLSRLTPHESAYHEPCRHAQIHHDLAASRSHNYRWINTIMVIVAVAVSVVDFRISLKTA